MSVAQARGSGGGASRSSISTNNNVPKPMRDGFAYSFGSPFFFSLILTFMVIYRSTGRHIVPHVLNPVREFQIMYCGVLSFFVLWNHSQHVTFFRWFSNPEFSFGQRRGLGHHPVAIFGIISAPLLTMGQFQFAGYSFILSLLLSCFNIAPRVFLVSSLFFYFMYFTQLWCETKAGGHGALTIAPVLIVLSLAPTLSDGAMSVSTWPLRLIQMTLCVQYCASGICKVAASLVIGRSWCSASVLQYYLYDAMWSRPGGEWSQYFMSFLIRTPALCSLSAIPAILFEVSGGIIISYVTNPFIIAGYAVAGISFHAGVWILQGLDFSSYWSPIFLAFVVYDDSITSIDTTKWIYELYADATNTNDMMLMICGCGCLIYGVGQFVVAVTFWDIHSKELLPWTCCPMFLLPLNIFDPSMPKMFAMTSADGQRCAGHLEPLLYSPLSPVYQLTEKEMENLPYRIIIFGDFTNVPDVLKSFFYQKYFGESFVMFSNFKPSTKLVGLLKNALKECRGTTEDAWNQIKLNSIVQCNHQCRAQFDLESWEAQQKRQ
jgi:hypothetical protein